MAAEPDPVDLRYGVRIGDAERERAADALGAHLRAGRLDPGEYDERVQAAFAARTAPELTPLFADLPDGSPLTPVPSSGAPHPASRRRGPASRRRGPAYRRRGPDARRRGPALPRAAVLLLLVVAVIAFTAVAHFPPFFLIPLFWFGFGRRFARVPHHGHGYGHGYGYGGPRRDRY